MFLLGIENMKQEDHMNQHISPLKRESASVALFGLTVDSVGKRVGKTVLNLVMFVSLGFSAGFSIPVFADVLAAASATADDLEVGRRIYMEGILPSGATLTGTRFASTTVSGAEAACVNCHRSSGMGQVEGGIQVPPITGNFLVAPKG